jgi:phosphinothricin acetyltransferase
LHETVSVRPGRESDVPAITAIYNYYVANTAVTFDLEPWPVDNRVFWFRQFAPTGRHRIVVAERDRDVVGYAYSTRFRGRAAYDPTVETTVYVHHDALRQGIGTSLYAELFRRLTSEDVHRAVACIALPNDPSIALHTDFGFEFKGIIEEVGHKFGKYWDIGWYVKPMP